MIGSKRSSIQLWALSFWMCDKPQRPKHPSALAHVAQTFRHVLWDLELKIKSDIPVNVGGKRQYQTKKSKLY